MTKEKTAVRDAIRTSEAGLANPASSDQFCTPTSPEEFHKIFPVPPCPMALARACPGLPSEFSTCFSDAPAGNSPEVFAVAPGVDPSLAQSEHGPCLVGGIIALDDALVTTKIAFHSGPNALAPFGCVALFDTGSPQTFISRGRTPVSITQVPGGYTRTGPTRLTARVRGKKNGYQGTHGFSGTHGKLVFPIHSACTLYLENPIKHTSAHRGL